MASEGILWFNDLTIVDPYYILPVLVATANLLNIEVSCELLLVLQRGKIWSFLCILMFQVLSQTSAYAIVLLDAQFDETAGHQEEEDSH